MINWNSFKAVSVVCISLFASEIYAQNTTAYFVNYPLIDENVEAFTNAFVKGLLPELQESEVRFDYTLENNVSRTDMAYGQISGTLTGATIIPDSNQKAEIDMKFRFNLDLVEPENRRRMYSMNFKTEGRIDNSAAFTDFFLGILIPKCQEQNISNLNYILLNACQALKLVVSDSGKTEVQKAYDLLTAWKQQLLEGLSAIDDRNFSPIKVDFLNYIDQRIQISNVNNQLNLSINMADLASKFNDQGYNFLFITQLLDYSIQNLNVQMDSASIAFSIYLQKLHHIDSLNNKYMPILNVFFPTIQGNPEIGKSIGEGFRMSGAIVETIISNTSTINKFSMGLAFLLGSTNEEPPATTERQSELGLD